MKRILLILGIAVAVGGAGFAAWKFWPASSNDKELRYVPVKNKDDDRWSILDLRTGQVVIDKEWKNRPTVGINGHLLVENKDGEAEIYTIEKKPRRIGKSYKDAGWFTEGLAPVVEKNMPITYINKDGKEVFTLKEADGAMVEQAGHFSEGMARFKDSKGKWGFINKSGKVAIKAKWDEASDFKEGFARVVVKEREGKGDTGEYIYKSGFINDEGEYVIKPEKDIDLASCFSEGMLAYGEKKDDKMQWGFMNSKGEKVIKSRKDLQQVTLFHQGYCSFQDGDSWGIMDKKGNTVVRAKYENAFYSEGIVAFVEKGKTGFMDLEGNEIVKPEYKEGFPFFGKNTIVKDGEKWVVIDKKGKEISKEDWEEIGKFGTFINYLFTNQLPLVESDFVDPAVEIGKVFKEITKESINGINESMPATEVAKAMDAKDYELTSYSSSIRHYGPYDIPNIGYTVTADFSDMVKRPIKKLEEFYGYTFETVVGYEPNPDAKLHYLKYEVDLYGKLAGKAQKLADELGRKLEKVGLASGTVVGNTRYYGGLTAAVAYLDDKLVLGFAFNGQSLPADGIIEEEEKTADNTEPMVEPEAPQEAPQEN